MNGQRQDHTIDLKQYLRVIWRRKGLIVLCTVVSLCSALVGLRFVPKQYESRVTLLVQDRQPMARELEAVMGGMTQAGSRYGADEERLSHMVGRVRSRPFLERVIRLLGMEKDPLIQQLARERQEDHPKVSVDELAVRILVQNLQSRITFGSTGAGVFRISVSDFSPENAQNLARWISELFVDTSIQNSLNYLRATHDFGAEQLRIYEEALRRSEDKLAEYRESAIEKRLDHFLVNEENLAQAEVLRQRISDEMITARIRSKSIVADLEDESYAPEDNRLLQSQLVQERIVALKSVLRDEVTSRLAAGVEVSWPPSGNYDARRRELFDELEAEAQTAYPEVSAQLRTSLARQAFGSIIVDVQADAAEMLRRAAAEFRGRARSQPDAEIELARLEAEVTKNQRLLESFQAQLVASEVNEAMETTRLGLQMEILDPAQLPLRPSKPNTRKILVAALLLGPMIGAGMAFAGETMDTTLRSVEEFARVSPEPVLGTTPLISRRIERPGRVRRYWVPATVSIVLLLTLVFFLVGQPLVQKVLTESQPVQMTVEEESQ